MGAVDARLVLTGDDVAQHREECRTGQVPGLGKDRRRRRTAPFDARDVVGHRKAHLGGAAVDRQLVEQRAEDWVVALVEDNEAGVDVVGHTIEVDRDGVGVSAGASVRFEDDDVVVRREDVRTREARDTGPDEGDTH